MVLGAFLACSITAWAAAHVHLIPLTMLSPLLTSAVARERSQACERRRLPNADRARHACGGRALVVGRNACEPHNALGDSRLRTSNRSKAPMKDSSTRVSGACTQMC